MREHLMALADGTVGAVRIKSFLPDHICQAVLSDISPGLLIRYDEDRYPVQAYRFGPTLNEYQDNGTLRKTYWHSAAIADRTLNATQSHGILRECIVDQLAKVDAGSVLPASIQGRAVYWPIIREISQGTLLHWDDISREYPNGLFDQHVLHQFALNVFLQNPHEGGELRVWRRKWQRDDEDHRHAFGYRFDLMRIPPDVTLRAERGEALIFNPSYYHDVRPSCGEGRRITLSLFVGATSYGLIVWS